MPFNSSAFTRTSMGGFSIAVALFTALRVAGFVEPGLSIPLLGAAPHTTVPASAVHRTGAKLLGVAVKGAGRVLVVTPATAGPKAVVVARRVALQTPTSRSTGPTHVGSIGHVVTRVPGGAVAVAPAQGPPVTTPADAPGQAEAPEPVSGSSGSGDGGGTQTPGAPAPVPTTPATDDTPSQSAVVEDSGSHDGGSEATGTTTMHSGRHSDSGDTSGGTDGHGK